MAFGYGAPMYNPYYPAQPQQMQAQQPGQSGGIQFVPGIEAAKSAYVAPGTSGLFMDSDKSRFYIKSVDTSGMSMPLRIFDYTEYTNSQQDTSAQNDIQQLYNKVELLAGKVDELISKTAEKTKGAKSDGKPAV